MAQSPDSLAALYASRLSIYREAGYRIIVGPRSPVQIVDEVMEALRRR
jgi:hypothetical protein